MLAKVVHEFERAVVFRLGRVTGPTRGPGLMFLIPIVDTFLILDMRSISFAVPPQERLKAALVKEVPQNSPEIATNLSVKPLVALLVNEKLTVEQKTTLSLLQNILTKDSVTVSVDAVVFYRVRDPKLAIIEVADYNDSTRLLAATTLRNILGTRLLSQLLSDREAISLSMQSALDEATEPWGIEVERVEIKDVRLPEQLQRAMAAEAEADREARAKIITAEGEIKASRALNEASHIMMDNPMALQLRYLQSLNSVSAEKNSTIIFPFPMDFLKAFMGAQGMQ